MFNRSNHSAEFQAVLALLYVFRQSMSELNGRNYHNSPERERLMASNQRQIEENNKTTKVALWYKMSDTYALEQLSKRLKKGTVNDTEV